VVYDAQDNVPPPHSYVRGYLQTRALQHEKGCVGVQSEAQDLCGDMVTLIT
jgi:hypothetical protein